jgi:hypothetical protein
MVWGNSSPLVRVYTATLSGAVSAGSNPAGGTGQRHKFEHSDNLERLRCQRCDLRKRGRVPDLAPYTCPTAEGRTGELPAHQHHTHTVSGKKTGRCSCANTATKRRWPSPQAPATRGLPGRTGQPVPPAGYWHRRADRPVTECDRTTLAASACNRSGRHAVPGSAVSILRSWHAFPPLAFFASLHRRAIDLAGDTSSEFLHPRFRGQEVLREPGRFTDPAVTSA